MNNQRRSRIALLINMISPARIPLYAGLAASFDLLILHGGRERNRDSLSDVPAMLPGAKIVKTWGWQIPIARREKGRAVDEQYFHFNPGYLWQLLRFKPDADVTKEKGGRKLIILRY